MSDETVMNEARDAVSLAMEKYGDTDDCETITNDAIRRLRRSNSYQRVADHLVQQAIQTMVHEARHEINRKMHKAMGLYAAPAKVVPCLNEGVQKTYRNCYLYFIGGRMLGDIRGEEIYRLYNSEKTSEATHGFKAAVLFALRDRVQPKQTIKQAISEKELKKLMERIAGDMRYTPDF